MRSQWDGAQHIREKKPIPMLEEWNTPNADIYVVFQTANEMPAKIRKLVDLLVRDFEPHRVAAKGPLGSW